VKFEQYQEVRARKRPKTTKTKEEVIKMKARKILSYILLFLVLTAMIFGSASQLQSATAMPMDPKDETKVPHYFGPNPNWALSPLREARAVVDLTGGGGTGATASAIVDPVSGAVTALTVTALEE
jgi:hypothetical protein